MTFLKIQKLFGNKLADKRRMPGVSLKKEGKTAETDELKSEAFNDQFSGVFTKYDDTSVPFLGTTVLTMDDIKGSAAGITNMLTSQHIQSTRSG